MMRKRNLPEELGIRGSFATSDTALDVSILKIKDMVNKQITSANSERKSDSMKLKKKTALIAVAATLVLGITVFATSGIISQWFSSSSSVPDYKTLPMPEDVEKDIGYKAVTIDEFKNGYKFDNGSIVNNNLKDEKGNSVEKFKSVVFRYKKDGDEVIFSQDKYNSDVESDGEVIASVDGINVFYDCYMNKCVPGNYKMTDEDKEAEESGALVFSYGSEKVEIIQVQSVNWVKDGIRYQLMQIGGKLSAEELSDMAAEIIKC